MSDENREQPWFDGVVGDVSRRIIECNTRFIQVVAGPGSGKTFGLQRRVRRLVRGDGVRQSLILVGTFTRAIRDELAAALAPSTLKEMDEEPVHVQTLHAQAYAMLRDHPASHPGREFRFLLEHEEAAMLYDIKDAVPELDFDDRRRAMHRVESYWSGATPLQDEKFRGAMITWLGQHRAMHVNEVAYLALNAMERGDLPVGTYLHVVVDEYQDLTSAEQRLVENLCRQDGCLMVLGDDDQSIYRFRYNHPGGITEFANGKDPSQLELITIDENRRSGELIVDIANRMMAAAGSKKTPMVSMLGERGEVDAIYWPTLDDEVSGLATYIRSQAETRFLVLVTRREIGYRLRDEIGTDAWTSFHEEVLRTHLVRERFALASLFANEDDPVALRAWFGLKGDDPEPAPERNAAAVKSLDPSGLSGRALLDAIVAETVKPVGSGQLAVRRRAASYLEHRKALDGLSLEEIIRYLFDPDLSGALGDPQKQRYAHDDFTLLQEAGLQIAARLREPTLARVIDSLRYRISTRQPLLEAEPDARVRIMTLHGAKGLEAETIIVAGLADQILPGKDVDDPQEAEERRNEQRRLLYVAVTRARRRLLLSWPRTMTYAEALSQNVRIDGGVFKKDGKILVGLGACRFLPAGVAATDGRGWLRSKGL
jgi:DNA helicase II / ATP-dependent DNA helicase PcrA